MEVPRMEVKLGSSPPAASPGQRTATGGFCKAGSAHPDCSLQPRDSSVLESHLRLEPQMLQVLLPCGPLPAAPASARIPASKGSTEGMEAG